MQLECCDDRQSGASCSSRRTHGRLLQAAGASSAPAFFAPLHLQARPASGCLPGMPLPRAVLLGPAPAQPPLQLPPAQTQPSRSPCREGGMHERGAAGGMQVQGGQVHVLSSCNIALSWQVGLSRGSSHLPLCTTAEPAAVLTVRSRAPAPACPPLPGRSASADPSAQGTTAWHQRLGLQRGIQRGQVRRVMLLRLAWLQAASKLSYQRFLSMPTPVKDPCSSSSGSTHPAARTWLQAAILAPKVVLPAGVVLVMVQKLVALLLWQGKQRVRAGQGEAAAGCCSWGTAAMKWHQAHALQGN